MVYSATYAPYGEIRTEQGTVDPLLKFSGKERDVESQLDYFGARYYDRNIYRFISVDRKLVVDKAIIDPRRWALYPYCMNNPITLRDPDGRDAINAQEGKRLVEIAITNAIGTPYSSPGGRLGEKGGADCVGAIHAIYQEAGLEYDLRSTSEFANSLQAGQRNAGLFIPIDDTAKLQEGDIGLFKDHMVMYGGKDENGADIVYSAHKPGTPFQDDLLSEWETSKKEKAKWYRYNKKNKKKDDKEDGK